ncbi:MAG: DsbC family protein, partial [Betaproteobacteria bacterium]
MNRKLLLLCAGFLGFSVAGFVAAQTRDAKPATPASPAAVRAATTAASVSPAMTNEESEVKRLMMEKFPGLQVLGVTKSPYLGLFEVFTGDQMAYTDAKVSYILVGTVIDPVTRTNLTEERIQALKAINVADLPLNQAIKIVRGKGERKLVVFSDADCPFCKRLEATLAEMDNFTAYVLLYPIDQLHPDAARKSKIIWCSADRQKSWLDYMLKGILPNNDGDCETPLPAL